MVTDGGGGRRRRGSGRPTMRDVAQAADVSVAVVSYCFNHPDRVAAVTRERVLATARALGYEGANAAARALRTGRTGVIGLICPEERRSPLDDPCDLQVARGVAHVAADAGLGLVLAPRGDALVDGVVTLGDAVGRPGLPRVAVSDGPASDADDCDRVSCDVAAGVAQGTSMLLEHGHRRFAVIGWVGDGARRESALRTLAGSGATVNLMEGESRRRGDGDLCARAALPPAAMPTAVIALSDEIAMSAMEVVASRGLRVPEDVSVMGVDDIPEAGLLGLTTVSVPYREKGEIAMGMLAALLRGDPVPKVPPLLSPFIPRRTTGPAPPLL